MDSQQLLRMFLQMGDLFQVPIILSVSFGFLTWYLSYAFISGLVVFGIAFAVNILIGNFLKTNQKEILKIKDDRMNETTQSITHIKFLKLNSW